MRRRKILVIDDDAAVRRGLGRCLNSLGYSVVTCATGVEALAKPSDQGFHLVIVDRIMPGMDGGELAQRIKAQCPSLPVLMLTAHPPENLPAGVDVVLAKGCAADELEGTIQSLIGNGT